MTQAIQTQAGSIPKPVSLITHSNLLQRKCACGGTPGFSGECEECRKKRQGTLQRATANAAFEDERPGSEVPSIVHEVIGSAGQPLDMEIRALMEPRFGHDFSQVRVHTDPRAAESALVVNALAYTVGRNVVFSTGQYAPRTRQGKRLMAHELTHVIQQGNNDQTQNEVLLGNPDDEYEREALEIASAIDQPSEWADKQAGETISTVSSSPALSAPLQRACLPAAQCTAPRSTLTEFVEETMKKPENIAKEDKRKKACTKAPRDPSCTSDGHASPAAALTAILKANYPSRLGYITGIYVNKDMPSNWGAVTHACADFMPPLPGGQCTFVPDTLEAQGKRYQGGAATVSGQPRKEWLTATIGTLTHETEHARFDTAAPIPEPSPTACKFADQEANLSELAAHLSEMHVYYRDALARPDKDRFKLFYQRFDFWVKNGSEDISGIVKDLRCKCECTDADYFITKTVESVSANQKWDSNERFMIHTELRDPKWALNWPVAPPVSVNVGDLPTTTPAPLKFE